MARGGAVRTIQVVTVVGLSAVAANSPGWDASVTFEVLDDLATEANWTAFDSGVVTRCIGSSHASTALRASWREQLAKVRSEIGFEYVRFHGLLDDDMSAVIKGTTPAEDSGHGGASTCSYVDDQDLYDEGGPTLPAATAEDCCKLCYTTSTGLPLPCVASVWSPHAGGTCHLKLNRQHPVNKTGSGLKACLTTRKTPKPYQYSFVNIFSVFDFIRSIGMRPVVEIGFMPSLLALRPEDIVFWYRGGISPPKDYSEWRDFMKALLTALIDRYGQDEVHQWYFEVWNEPNCGFFVEGKCCGEGCGNQTAYMDMYVETFKALKEVDPKVRVGGPATAQLGWLGDFVTSAGEKNALPDFVTSHLYPTDPVVEKNVDGFADSIANAVHEITAASSSVGPHGYSPPLIMTEFNCGLGINCMDDTFAGSFIAYNMLRAQATRTLSPMWSYWTFSDIFEEEGQVPREFSQAFGLQSINGIPKPVYRTMQLLRRLHSRQVRARRRVGPVNETDGISVAVTAEVLQAEDAVDVEVLVVSHPSIKPIAPSSTASSARNVTIEFPGAVKLMSNVEIRRVDSLHSNALTHYAEIGSPPYPTRAQLQGLTQHSEIQVKTVEILQDSPLKVTLSMPATSAVATLHFRVSRQTTRGERQNALHSFQAWV